MLVLTDFPDASGAHERLAFTDPLEVAVAWTVGDVRAVLARVERRCAADCFAVGFVAYDAAPAFDAALQVPGHAPTPLAWFVIHAAPSAFATDVDASRATRRYDWSPHVNREQYEICINDIHKGITDGAFYQVNQTVRLRTRWQGDAESAYESLRAVQPSSYGMYIDTGRFQIASVSPELFFSRTGRDIVTRPMKGTARRGRWLEEDGAAAASLAASEKDRAENVMIVDLVRNDLGRISELGTITVSQLFAIESHPTVWQMTSTIVSRLREDVSLVDIFAALFPSGSVIGAPKVSAASWIANNEAAPRGIYCGAMGIVRPGGDCMFNVAIRTLVIDSETGVAEYGTGGAVTIDSTATGEYDELMAKAGILRGPEPSFELIETMRLCNGVIVRRERHVKRVVSSAAYFDFPEIAELVETTLSECACAFPTGNYRVRLLVSRDGTTAIETKVLPITPAPLRAPFKCVIANTPVDSRDPFLFHKTTNRVVYDERRSAHPKADEIILVNERGEVTECSIGNLVVEIDGRLVTPPCRSGLLAGVFREELLERGIIHERVLLPSDLACATRIWMINSVREWVELTLAAATDDCATE